MTTKAESILAHHSAFEAPLANAKTRADWLLNKYLASGNHLMLARFERAAVAHQMAARREFAAREIMERIHGPCDLVINAFPVAVPAREATV